jgi:predicted NUDIX family phosphoesterase
VTRDRLFSSPIKFDSSHGTVIESNAKLLGELLPKFREWADPLVAVLPRAVVTDLLGKSHLIPAEQAEATWAKLRPQIHTKRRSDVEYNEEWVQVVACGVQTHKGGVFVLERSARDDKSKNYGKQVVWKGCHVAGDDPPDLVTLERCLVARMKQDLHLAVDLKPELMGIVWDEDSERFHVGVMFQVPITLPDVARSMEQKEFRRGGRYHTTTGTFQSIADLRAASGNLEPWSVRLLEGMGIDL